MGQASQVAYYEYPFHALPDLGLVNRAHFPFEYFGGEATKLTAEEMKIIRSGYLWAQTYGGGLVPSTQTSYSELWFIFQYIIRQMQLFCSVSWIDEAKEKSKYDYNRAVAKSDSGQYYYYGNWKDLIRPDDYGLLSCKIKSCAMMEADLAQIRHEKPSSGREVDYYNSSDGFEECGPHASLTPRGKKRMRKVVQRH
jgi:hypothetical protein